MANPNPINAENTNLIKASFYEIMLSLKVLKL